MKGDRSQYREIEKSALWGVFNVMQLSAKRGHVCAADSLVSEDINILQSLPVMAKNILHVLGFIKQHLINLG